MSNPVIKFTLHLAGSEAALERRDRCNGSDMICRFTLQRAERELDNAVGKEFATSKHVALALVSGDVMFSSSRV